VHNSTTGQVEPAGALDDVNRDAQLSQRNRRKKNLRCHVGSFHGN